MNRENGFIVKGYVAVFPDNVDTDQIYPGRYLELTEPEEIGQHAMEGINPDFRRGLKTPGIIIGGKNFGCGSSREHAAIALKNAGVQAVIAESFGRIFYRNAINLGLPVIICPGISGMVREGEELVLDLEQGSILVAGREHDVQKMPFYVREILVNGGLISYLRQELTKESPAR
ncbi:MAG: LeuD/DmdB family oxidoreductase small subunit [Desulfitobacteriaceae bacterium]